MFKLITSKQYRKLLEENKQLKKINNDNGRKEFVIQRQQKQLNKIKKLLKAIPDKATKIDYSNTLNKIIDLFK